MSTRTAVIDGAEAIARVAHKLSEVIAIFPITPSSPSVSTPTLGARPARRTSGARCPVVAEMQSRAAQPRRCTARCRPARSAPPSPPARAAVDDSHHVQDRGRTHATCWHVPARAIAAQALSIFGDQQDVMAVRQTGFAC